MVSLDTIFGPRSATHAFRGALRGAAPEGTATHRLAASAPHITTDAQVTRHLDVPERPARSAAFTALAQPIEELQRAHPSRSAPRGTRERALDDAATKARALAKRLTAQHRTTGAV
ncbi:hypothetical protein ACFWZY_10315 [Streptomyces sp. NPDC058992]|uniref:hypothetical protein n=1 Tax=Streptomyces sp. NPDC058992 TaxID=3346688 RepID=UPI00368E935D